MSGLWQNQQDTKGLEKRRSQEWVVNQLEVAAVVQARNEMYSSENRRGNY